jgi:hypothetical protein
MSPSDSAERAFPNPFGRLAGQPLEDHQVDIADIHADAFQACQRLVRDVAEGGFSAALTVFGDTGTGKTHLIGRIRRWLEPQPDRLFVFVRMETSPAGIWRHLRRCLALSLQRVDARAGRALDRLFAGRKDELQGVPNRDLAIVLEHLLEGRHIRDSAAWLRGEGLPEEALQAVGLSSPSPDEDPEVTSRHIVMAICELISPGVVVFCMDQIEAVMSSPGDRDGPHAFGRMVSCLVDESRNAGVICCQQSSFVNTMEQILDGAARSRLFGRRAGIGELSWEQAQRLIRARLDTAPQLAARRAGQSACWPLPEATIREVFRDEFAPARRIISRCKDLFDQWQSGRPTVIEPLDTALEKLLEERFTPHDPGETESILRNGMPLLARSVGMTCTAPGNRSPLDFVIEGRTAVAICNQAHATSLASHVKKISAAWQPAPGRPLLLLRDARLPVSPNAKATHQRIASIQQQGGRLVPVSPEAVNALAALRRLLSDAESGDLAHHGDVVTPGAVEQWIAGHLPPALDSLVAEFGPAPPKPSDLPPRLAALLAERKMVSLEDAARTLAVQPGEVEDCARRDPRQFGILAGSNTVLFQPAPSQ